MRITEDKLVDTYAKSSAKERFKLIYKNYEIFPQLIDCCEVSQFNRIIGEKEYNRKAKNGGDLGVRVKNSRLSNPTQDKAIENVTVEKAIQECDFSDDLLKDTDDAEAHRRCILTINMMKRDYEVFDANLKALRGSEFRITYRYIHKDCSVAEIAEEESKADQTIRNTLALTRKTLERRIIPFFMEAE
ncbi:MAG: hypothetical protein J5840_09760 [Lachnospiraceae bacterium]|nr:hypothetical protein [Lachnospiraceae bacterium]